MFYLERNHPLFTSKRARSGVVPATRVGDGSEKVGRLCLVGERYWKGAVLFCFNLVTGSESQSRVWLGNPLAMNMSVGKLTDWEIFDHWRLHMGVR